MKVLLGITGSVAATLTTKMVSELEKNHEVIIIATNAARNFLPIKFSGLISKSPIYFDEDEWNVYATDAAVLHIDLVKWADKFIIAPCTANTLTKIHLGLCDNLVTSCVRAWPNDKNGIILAPAMNCNMWDKKHLDTQYKDLVLYGSYCWVPPQCKKLFCGDEGMGAMANIDDIIKRI